jgi:hypothetical protein
MNWYKIAQQVSRQSVRDAIAMGPYVVMALGYMSNPASLTKGIVTQHQNEFTKFQEVVKYVKQKFTGLGTSIQGMDEAQFDRNIPILIKELVAIDNYINQYISYFGFTDVGTNITDFSDIISPWKNI